MCASSEKFPPPARPPFWKRQTRDENVDNFIKTVFHSTPKKLGVKEMKNLISRTRLKPCD